MNMTNRAPIFFKPTLMDLYLFRQTTYLLMITLLIGGGVYLMTELFDSMDNFIEAGTKLKYIILYFVVKLPFILGQILPAAFLLSVIIQLCLMAGSRELLALQAGGVSLWRIALFFIFYAVFWGGLQLGLSQNLGVTGNNYAKNIWSQHVASNPYKYSIVRNFWLMEDNLMIYAREVNVKERTGEGIVCYKLSGDGLNVERVVRAPVFSIENRVWTLNNATIYDTNGFVHESNVDVQFEIDRPISGLRLLGEDVKLRDYSLWQIGADIERLKKSGSNVEALRTGWHMKLAYAASLVVMSLVAVALITWKENLYINLGLGLVITFIFYAILTVSGTLGENGRLSPIVAAWSPVVLVGGISFLWTVYKVPPCFLSNLDKFKLFAIK